MTEVPHNSSLEQDVLAQIVLDPELFAAVGNRLTPDHFYIYAHRSLYEIIVGFVERGRKLDPTVLDYELAAHLGGEGRLIVHEMIASVDYFSDVEAIIETLEELRIRRQVIEGASKLAQCAYNAKVPTREVLDSVLEFGTSITESGGGSRVVTARQSTDELLTDLETGKVNAVSTGFVDLDEMIIGLEPGNIYAFGAVEKTGKTALKLSMAKQIALRPERPVVLFFSLEMSHVALMRRLVSQLTGIEVQRLKRRQIQDEEWEKIYRAKALLEESNLIIDDTPAITPGQIRARCLETAMKYGRIDVVFIDYFQKIGHAGRWVNENEKHIAASEAIRELAKTYNVPIVMSAQVLSKSIAHRANPRPQLSDIRGSSALQADCYLLAMLYREEGEELAPADPVLEVIIRAHRDGPTGTVRLYYKAETNSYHNLEMKRPWETQRSPSYANSNNGSAATSS